VVCHATGPSIRVSIELDIGPSDLAVLENGSYTPAASRRKW
jgi:hypothetical protein